MPKLFIITGEWSPHPWLNTGGTRAKKYFRAPDGKFYYFKRSQYKDATAARPGKDYKYEFWSEVIAYEVGMLLGFTMLRYDIAAEGEIMGCISESMINSEQEELIEGVKYLQAFAPDYEPANKQHQTRYTFHLIEHALRAAKLGNEMNHIVELIVFDALIGNGDRHQENWAFISRQQPVTSMIEEVEKDEDFSKMKRWKKWLLKMMKQIMKQGEASLIKRGKPLPKSYFDVDPYLQAIYNHRENKGKDGWSQGNYEFQLRRGFNYKGPLPKGGEILVLGSYVVKRRVDLHEKPLQFIRSNHLQA